MSDDLNGRTQTSEPEWTDAEHDEIMRLHIIEGMTVSGAKWHVYQKRDLGKPFRGESDGE